MQKNAEKICENEIFVVLLHAFSSEVAYDDFVSPKLVWSPHFLLSDKHCHNVYRVEKKKEVLKKVKAQMAESVDALVSNTSGAIRAGSTPALGTKQLTVDS